MGSQEILIVCGGECVEAPMRTAYRARQAKSTSSSCAVVHKMNTRILSMEQGKKEDEVRT